MGKSNDSLVIVLCGIMLLDQDFLLHPYPSMEGHWRFQVVGSCKWFQPRNISSLSSVIIQVSVVLKRTVVVNNNSFFQNYTLDRLRKV